MVGRMPISFPDVRGIMPGLRYPSVHGRPSRDHGACRRGGPGARAASGSAAAFALAALLGGCAPGAEPRTFAVPSAAAARIRMVCPPGTFIGTMTANCPQILPAAR